MNREAFAIMGGGSTSLFKVFERRGMRFYGQQSEDPRRADRDGS
jgi:hypothetical protein